MIRPVTIEHEIKSGVAKPKARKLGNIQIYSYIPGSRLLSRNYIIPQEGAPKLMGKHGPKLSLLQWVLIKIKGMVTSNIKNPAKAQLTLDQTAKYLE